MIGVLVGIVSLGSLLPFWFGLIGAALSLIFLAFFFAVFTVSKIVAAFMFGKWLMKVVFKQTEEKVWLDLLVGVFLFVVIRAIPFVGWLAGLAATLIGAGALLASLEQSAKQPRNTRNCQGLTLMKNRKLAHPKGWASCI